MYQNFNFTRIVGESAYPGIEVEETFEGVVNLPEDDDTEPELISVKRNGRVLNANSLLNRPSQAWKRFDALCFEAARDAAWKERSQNEMA